MNGFVKTMTVMALTIVIVGCIISMSDSSEAATGTEITQDRLSEHLSGSSYNFQDGDYYLGSDLNISYTIVFHGDCNLNLNGFSITSSATDAVAVASGSLTVDDTSASSNGKITSTAGSNSHAVMNQAVLVIKGGTFEADRAILNSTYQDYEPSTTISGGTIKGSTVGINIANGTAAIEKGTIEASTHAVLVSGVGECSISGGDFEANTVVQCQIGGTLTIEGGNFNSVQITGVEATPVALSVITVNGGGKTSAIVNGGVFKSVDSGIIVLGGGSEEDSASLDFNNGTVTADNGFGVCGNGTADYTDIVIKGGSIISTNGPGIYHPQIGNLTITAGTIEGTTGIQYCGAGNLTISGGRVVATYEASDIPDKPSDQGDGSFDDGAAVSIVTRGPGYQDDDAEINTINVRISGGEFISKNNSAVASYRAEKSSEGMWVFGDDTTIKDSSLDSFVISGGTFSSAAGNDAIDFDSVEAERVYRINGGSFDTNVEDDFIALGYRIDGDTVNPNLIATIDGVDYYWFTDAVEAAKNSDDKSFTLLTDIDLSDVGDLDVSGLTIDFGGKKVTADWMTLFFVGEDFTLTNGTFDNKGADYGLWIGDEIAVNGAVLDRITVDGGINIYNSQNVTLRNVTAVGKSYYAVWCDQGGNVTIESGNYSSESSHTSSLLGASSVEASMQISGGTFTIGAGKNLALSGEYTSPVITGGTFNGLSEDDLSDYLADGYELDNGTVTASQDADFVAEVAGSNYTSLSEAIESAGYGATVKLLKDTTTEPLRIEKNITLDLGEFTLTIKSESSTESWGLYFVGVQAKIIGGTIVDERSKDNPLLNERYTIMVTLPNADLTIEETTIQAYSPSSGYNDLIRVINRSSVTLIDATLEELGEQSGSASTLSGVTILGVTGLAEPSVLNVEGNTRIEVSGYGITGNAGGNNDNTVINIYGGIIKSSNVTAILHTHVGVLNIYGGTIIGPTAVEIRAGELNISGDARLIATDTELAEIDMGSGLSLGGVAVGISQHVTEKDINVTITGGTFIGVYAFYEKDLKNDDSDNITATISGGTFIGSTGSAFSENMTGFISGGTYLRGSEDSNEPDVSLDETYLTDNSKMDLETGSIVETVTVTFDMPDGNDREFEITKGTTVPEIPGAPVGYSASFTVNGSAWNPAFGIYEDTKVIVSYVLDEPALTIDSVVEGIDATVTVSAESAADVTYTYSAVGPNGDNVEIINGSFTTQYPGTYTVSVTADGEYDTADATGTIDISFESQTTSDGEIYADIEQGSTATTVTVDGIEMDFENVSYGNLHVTITEIETAEIEGYGASNVAYEISVRGSGVDGDEIITVCIPIVVPDGQHIVEGSAVVLFVPENGDPEDMNAYVGADGSSIVFTTTHNSAYHMYYDMEADLPPFIPFPPQQGGDPIEVWPPDDGGSVTTGSGDSGSDTLKVVACAAAAVIAAILIVVWASTYRKN